MIFQHFLLIEANESNLYVAGCPETRKAVIIDAGAMDDGVVSFVKKNDLNVTAVLLTHDHWDHMGGREQYEKLFKVPTYGAADFSDGQDYEAGALKARVFTTSGHTPDSVSFYFPDEGVVFTGDALFAGSVGGTSSDAKQKEEVGNIREKILALPDSTLIYSGHGPATTVGTEKACNVFLKADV
jgi:hydroxyacylglutathione hydrolase